MKTNEERRQVVETIGAIQDTIRVHANTLEHIHQHLYANIISLDLIFMDVVSELPKKMRHDILQNQFDESKTGAENDLVAMTKIRDYFNKRIEDCETHIQKLGSKEDE